MNELTVNFYLFELNLWEGLALLVALYGILSFQLEKGARYIEEKLMEYEISKESIEQADFAKHMLLLPFLVGLMFAVGALFFDSTLAGLTRATMTSLLASGILGAVLCSASCVVFGMLRFWEVKNLPLHFLVKEDILMSITGSVGEKLSRDMYIMSIKDSEQARLLVEGIPLVTKYQELLAKQQRLSKKAKTEQQHQLLAELETVMQEKKLEVQALFPVIYGALGMENPYLASESEWEDMAKELEEANLNRPNDTI